MLTAHARHVWVTVCWVGAVTATALNGVVVGYGAVWFQLFGETADAEDYLVSAGGYGAAAVVLVLAVPGILTHRGPRRLRSWVCSPPVRSQRPRARSSPPHPSAPAGTGSVR